MTESVMPEQGRWFEHALERERDGRRAARCVVLRVADVGRTALPQVFYRRLDAPSGSPASSIDVDLFGDIVLRWLTPDECAEAVKQARF